MSELGFYLPSTTRSYGEKTGPRFKVSSERPEKWGKSILSELGLTSHQQRDHMEKKRDLGLKSHPKDRRSGGSILRTLDW